MTGLVGLLVGAHFRPPAKILAGLLPSGSSVECRLEPDNPYDADAVAVWLPKSAKDEMLGRLDGVALGRLELDLAGCGWTLDGLAEFGDVQLGYLAREGNRELAKREASCGPLAAATYFHSLFGEAAATVGGKFILGPSGEWLIRCEGEV